MIDTYPAEPHIPTPPEDQALGFTASPQDGLPGHCVQAQVFGPDGKSVATFEPTEDPAEATLHARRCAMMLNTEDNLDSYVRHGLRDLRRCLLEDVEVILRKDETSEVDRADLRDFAKKLAAVTTVMEYVC